MSPFLVFFGLLILLPVSSAQECNPESATKCGTDCHCLNSVNCGTITCRFQCQPFWTGFTCQTVITGVVVGCSLVVLALISIAICVVRRRMRQRARTSANDHNQTMDTYGDQAIDINEQANLPEAPSHQNAQNQTKDSVTSGDQAIGINEPAKLTEAPSSVYENQPVSVRFDGSTATNLYDHLDGQTSATVYTTARNPQNTEDSDGYCLPVV